MINLARYRGFFGHFEALFPKVYRASASRGITRRKLKVETVGAFEASFVPSQAEFDRLDERFRLPGRVWKCLSKYDGRGFAVFQIAAGTKKRVHPLGLSFRPMYTDFLFFPTVHVHDESVPPKEQFDHTLYGQIPRGWRPPNQWERSQSKPETDRLPDFVLRSQPVFQKHLVGELPNQDHWLTSTGKILTD